MELETTEIEVTPTTDAALNKASRWKRLWASLIDTFILLLFIVPMMYITGGFDGIKDGVQPSIVYSLLIGLLSIVVFIIINGKLLTGSGQTVGKRAMGIKIVSLSGELPTVKEHLLKRYGIYFLLGQVPFIGQILSVANVLIIFGKQRRCGHDHIAGTTVVNC